VNVFKLLVEVCNVPITVLLLPVYVFNRAIEPVTPSIEFNLLFCVDSIVLFELVKLLKSVLILPLALSKDINLPLVLDVNVLVLEVYEFSELVVVSKAPNLLFCVDSIVLFELVKLLKSLLILELADSKEFNLLFALEVNVFKLPVVDSIVFNRLVALDVNIFKEDVVVSRVSNLPFCKLFVVLLDELYALNTTSSNLPVPTGTPFNVIEPEMVKAPVISVFVLTLKPSTLEIEAVTLPSAIRVKLSPVTPLAGILVRLLPSPPNDPVKDPVV
jgi:hypothetical protein